MACLLHCTECNAYSRYVKFRFTVSAEKGFDGLLFFIDSVNEPAMQLESNQAREGDAEGAANHL